MTDLPIACTLDAAALRARSAELLPGLLEAARAVSPLAEGMRLTLPATSELLARAMAVVDGERQCCPFLRFVIEVPPGGADCALEVTGPPGTRDYLVALAATLARPAP